MATHGAGWRGSMMLRLVVLVAVLMLACPGAVAEAEGPVRGEATFHGPASLEGALDASAREGALDLSAAALAGQDVSVAWSGASGRFVETNWTTVTTPVLVPDNEEPATVHALDLGAARLRVRECGPHCALLLLADGEGVVALSGNASGPLGRRAQDAEYCASFCKSGDPAAFTYASHRGAILLAGGGGDPDAKLRDAVPRAEGRVELIAYDAVVQIDDAHGGGQVLDLRTSTLHPTGVGVSRTRSAFVRLALEGASIDARPGASALLMAETLDVALAGALSSPSASGNVEYAGERQTFDHEILTVEGKLSLRFASAPPGPVQALEAVSPLVASVGGTATRVEVGDRAIVPASGGAPAATGVWVLLVVAAGLLARPFVVAPLYSRVRPDRVLQHPNRQRLLALLRERPGLTVRELGEGAGLARIVVKHHLAMLAAHGIVRKTYVGRASRHFAADAPLDGPALAARLTLQDATRRRVAQVIASRGGATQRDLIETTGLSQRLVSYHLARLSRTSLVAADEASPRCYRPTPLLIERLAGAP